MPSVCRLSELMDRAPRKFDVDGEDVLVVRIDEDIFAVSDVCSHSEVSLSEGDIVGSTIECWLHGSAFNLKTGVPLGPPATQPIETFDVTLSDGADPEVFVSVRS